MVAAHITLSWLPHNPRRVNPDIRGWYLLIPPSCAENLEREHVLSSSLREGGCPTSTAEPQSVYETSRDAVPAPAGGGSSGSAAKGTRHSEVLPGSGREPEDGGARGWIFSPFHSQA